MNTDFKKETKRLIKVVKKYIPVETVENWGGGGGANYYKQEEDAKAIVKIIANRFIEEYNDVFGSSLKSRKDFWNGVLSELNGK